MKSKIFAVATFAFAFAFALSAGAVYQSDIYTASSGYLQVGSGMGAKAYQAPNVIAAQTALNACVPGMSLALDGKFGPLTKGKFVSFQNSKNIKPDGVIGPVTAGQLAACSGGASTPSTPGSSTLDGTDGTINDVSTLSQYSGEEVGEGEDEVKVAGFEVEASNDGDVMLKSIKVTFDPTGNATGDSDHLDDYITGVTVWMGSEEIGSADADDFSENSNDTYSKTISLDGAIVRADETEKFYISVDAPSTFDSGDIDGTVDFSVGIENIRYSDGSGVVTTLDASDSSFDDGDGQIGWNAVGDGLSFDAVGFSDSADTVLKISTASDSPEGGVVLVKESASTDNVVLLKGKLKLEGDSDVTIDEFPVSFSPVGANANVIAEGYTLVLGGDEFSESVSSIADGATGTVTFDNLDFVIEAGDTIEFEVLADIAELDGTTFAEGDSLEANVTSDNRAMMDAENEESDQLSEADSEKSGTANGEAQLFRTEGISVTLVSTAASVTTGTGASDDLGEFTIKFKVKANGSAIYVSSLAAASLTTSGTGAVAGVERSGTATIGGVSVTIVNDTDDDLTSGVGNFLIEEGDEETFIMTTTVQLPTAGPAGQYRALLRALDWATTDTVTYNSYESNLDSFKTSYKALN